MEAEQFGVRSGGWSDLPTTTASWDEGRARAALDAWAGDSMSKYARGFLWSGPDTENKTNYKFPIAAPIDGKLTIYQAAVNNAKARLNQANIPAEDKQRMLGILNSIQARYRSDSQEMALVASVAPVHPPKAWFSMPPIGPKNKIVVTDEGRIYGWVAPPAVCHRGAMAANGTCITPATMARTFAHFETGTTKTAEGDLVDTGTLVWDTTHADTSLRASFAKRHYEDTGMAFAGVKAGFKDGGIWFSGTMLPGSTDTDYAKARRHSLSVDARRVGQDLALIAALAVNAPGFPVLTASLGEDDEDMGVEVAFEEGVQMTLLASWAPSEEMFEVAEVVELAETVAPDPVGAVSTDEGCGCPDVKATLSTLQPLLTPAETAERRSILSGYGKI